MKVKIILSTGVEMYEYTHIGILFRDLSVI